MFVYAKVRNVFGFPQDVCCLSNGSMMGAPRKFSDKIALLTQKQIEGTAAFDAILREVSATTRVSLF